MPNMRPGWVAMLIMLAGIANLRMAVAQAPPSAAGIEERLVRLEAGQVNLEKRLDDLRADMNQRFEDLNRKMDQRFDDMNRKMDQRFDDMNQKTDGRFDGINHRIGDLITYMQIQVTVLAAVGIGIFGTLLLMWRRLVKVEADVAILTSQFRLIRAP